MQNIAFNSWQNAVSVSRHFSKTAPLQIRCFCLAGQYYSPGEKAVQWFLWLPHLTHGEYTASSRSCVVPTCKMHQGERAGTLWWPMSCTHTSKLAQCMSDRGATWFPAWCLTSRSSSPTYSCKTELCQSDAGLPSAATRGVNCASQINKCIDHFNMSICHLECWARRGRGNL